jgi:signal transduction histidine kinase
VPIVSEGRGEPETIGVISIEGPADHPDFFTGDAQETLCSLAREAVGAIEQASWSATVQSTLALYRLRRILAVSQAVVSQQTLDQVLQQIARIAFDELRADLLTLYRWDAAEQDFITPPIRLGVFRYPDAMQTQIHRGDVVDKVFHEWGSRFFTDARRDPELRSLGRVPPRDGQLGRERFPIREGIASSAILRLQVGMKRVGVLCVNWRVSHSFDEAEQAVLEIFANHVALAIENDRLMRLAVAQATDNQRERLHRDLHDDVGGKLTAIKHLAATAKGLLDQTCWREAGRRLAEIEERTMEAYQEVRHLLADLEPLRNLDLKKSLSELCRDQTTRRCRVSFATTGSVGHLRDGQPQAVYRVAREAIANAKGHGEATSVHVNLHVDAERLELVVMDNGRGGTMPPRDERRRHQKYGVTIMEELAFTVGGQLDIAAAQEEGGWSVTLSIPTPAGITEDLAASDAGKGNPAPAGG